MSDEGTPEVTPVADGTPELAGLGWKTELPASLRENEAFAGYKTKNDLWSGHIDLVNKAKDLEGKLTNSIPKLSDEASDEERKAYYNAIGVPEAPTDYEFDVPEGIELDPSMVDWYKEVAHKSFIPKSAAKALFNAYNERMAEIVKARNTEVQKAIDTAQETLKAEWGGDFDKNVEFTKRAWNLLGGEELKTAFEESGLGNDPRVIKAFFNIWKKIGEDNLVGGETPKQEVKIGMSYTGMEKYSRSD